jgi:hypothetical protein
MNLRPKTKESLQNILDCMTGADGGVRILKLKCFLETFDAMATIGDDAAEEIVLILHRFSKMIDIANRE